MNLKIFKQGIILYKFINNNFFRFLLIFTLVSLLEYELLLLFILGNILQKIWKLILSIVVPHAKL